jgi:hypothetical protein
LKGKNLGEVAVELYYLPISRIHKFFDSIVLCYVFLLLSIFKFFGHAANLGYSAIVGRILFYSQVYRKENPWNGNCAPALFFKSLPIQPGTLGLGTALQIL